MIDYQSIHLELLKALGKDNSNKMLVARTVYRDNKTFIQHFWVNPDEVKRDDRIVTKYPNVPDNSQKYHHLEWESDAYDLLGDWGDTTKPFGKWKEKMPLTHEQALEEYTYNSDSMNNYLRYDKTYDDAIRQNLETDRKRIEDAMSSFEIPEPLTVHRAVGVEMLEKFEQAQKFGGIFKESAFCSTTVIEGSFGGREKLQMVIDVPPGKGIGAWVAPLSEFPEEAELLLNHGTLFEVHNITPATKEHGPIVELTVVGRDPSHP